MRLENDNIADDEQDPIVDTLVWLVDLALRMPQESYGQTARTCCHEFEPFVRPGCVPDEASLEALAELVAEQVWLRLPRPESDLTSLAQREGLTATFFPEPAGRNDPCPCGSGLKHKKCCLDRHAAIGRVADRSALRVLEQALDEVLLELTLGNLSDARLKRLAETVGPAHQLDIARQWTDRDHPRHVMDALERIGVPAEDDWSQADPEALVLLAKAYADMRWTKKGAELVRSVAAGDASEDTVAPMFAVTALATAEAGRPDAARELLNEAAARHPHNADIGVLHATIPLVDRDFEEARRTAAQVLDRLPPAPPDREEDRHVVLRDIVDDPQKAFDRHILGVEIPVELYAKLADVYERLVEAAESPPAADVFERVGDDEWRLVADTPTSGQMIWDRVPPISDDDARRQLEELVAVLEAEPTDLDALDRSVELVHVLGESVLAFGLAGRACDLLKSWMPPELVEGGHRLEWGWLENRPCLRLLHSHMLFVAGVDPHEAYDIARWLLRLNPGDNTGARETATGLALQLERWRDALHITEHYADDTLPTISYGRALALFHLDEPTLAREALEEATRMSPLVAQVLLGRDGSFAPSNDTGVLRGGTREATFYEEEWGHLWRDHPDVFRWLAEHAS